MNLRESTAELHSKAEKMQFNQRMFNGELSKEEYLNHLIQQSAIFTIIEQHRLPHPSLNREKKIFEMIIWESILISYKIDSLENLKLGMKLNPARSTGSPIIKDLTQAFMSLPGRQFAVLAFAIIFNIHPFEFLIFQKVGVKSVTLDF